MKSMYEKMNNDNLEKLKKEREDKKVIFTNGCFDLMHYGHMFILHTAKLHGDILVVGLNSDSSVKLNKGNTRPILDERQRLYSLNLFPPVDYVFLFDDITPMKLIKDIEPDILVKGADWKNKIVGEDYVIQRGGEVIVVELDESISTTMIIDKCRSMHSS